MKDIKAEKVVIGSLILYPDLLIDAIELIDAEAFTVIEHQELFKAIEVLFDNGKAISNGTIEHQYQKETGRKVDTLNYLDTATGNGFVEHCLIVKEKHLARLQGALAVELSSKSNDPKQDPLDTNEYLITEAEKLSNQVTISNPVTNKELIDNVTRKIELAGESQGLTGVRTGFNDLDRIYGGRQKTDLIIKAARPAMGKLQPLTEPVLTPDGWVTMGDIKKGSIVSCPVSGEGVEVLNVYPQENLDIYKVTFNDGSYTECCNEHLWLIQTQTDVSNGTNRVVDVDWMLKKGVRDSRNKSRFRIPLTNPVEFNRKEIQLHPYLVGLFIADGYLSSKHQVTVTCHSKDALERFELIKRLVPNDVKVRLDRQYGNVKARKITFSYEIRRYLKSMGLLDMKSRQKFIPKNYLYNSVEVRMQLLNALMDCDGSCFLNKSKTAKQESYSTMSNQLKDDVIELVKSLGGKASANAETREKYNGGTCWNISIKTPFNPFTNVNKREVFDSVDYKETFSKTIRSIEYLRNDKGQCISVNSNHHLYITRDYTVTHNTAQALCEAKAMAFDDNKRVLFFSLEMGAEQLMQRLVSIHTGIPLNDLRKGTMNTKQWDTYNEEVTHLTKDNLIIVDDVYTLVGIKTTAKKYKLRGNIDAIYIDYLQLIEHRVGGRSKENEVSEISRSLKMLAKQLDVPVIALSQLSRAVETRGGSKKPQLSDLRDSGAIEQDADIVEFIYRPEYYNPEEVEYQNKAYVIIAKNRNGSCADVEFFFNKECTRFENVANEYTVSKMPMNEEFEPPF